MTSTELTKVEHLERHAADSHADVARQVLAGALLATPSVAVRVLEQVQREWWPHPHYAVIADTVTKVAKQADDTGCVDAIVVNAQLMQQGFLAHGDAARLWLTVSAPGTGLPPALEPQLMFYVPVLWEWHYRAVWHTVMADDDGNAFVWSVDDLNAATRQRVDALCRAFHKQHAKAVKL